MGTHLFALEVMKAVRVRISMLVLGVVSLLFLGATPAARFMYPTAAKGTVVDDYFGTKVPDPYRWLEDPDSAETKAWVEAENKLTFGYLDKIPGRNKIKDRLTKLWDYEKYGVPFRMGNHYFYQKNNGLQNQSVLYTTTSLDSEPRVLLDPNPLSADGTVAISGLSFTDDGSIMAYSLSAAGSDWDTYKFRKVDTGEDLPDQLNWMKFSGCAWTLDNKGVYYSRFPQPKEGASLEEANYYNKLYYHKLGMAQSEDALIYERPDEKDWGFYPTVTEDGQYLIITISKGTDARYRVYYKDLKAPDSKVTPLIDAFDAEYSFVGNDGPVFWFKTNLNAPLGKVIAVDTRHPERESWKDVIPEAKESLDSVSLVHDQFIGSYLKDAHSQIKFFSIDGKLIKDLDLPGLGSAQGFFGKRTDSETFYSFTGFTTPVTIYHYDFASGKATVFRQPKVGFNPQDYETIQVFYASKDGTKIPMFLSYKKGMVKNGKNPTLLYGYGGFDISETPAFSVSNLVWMEMGGIYASANMRGGGEYGEAWHQAGTKDRKQNVFDDFIAAAEYLIANHYTSTPQLAINGASNGGLLIGACLNQRPDLYGAALPAVGVMDMLRFQKFTIGWAWVDDYGSSDDAHQFKTLYAYSPLHNIKPGTKYPPVLITTADHDDRVVPGHSFKYAAALQAAQGGPAPILIRIEVRAGHGYGKPTTKLIDDATDKIAFLTSVLHM
jgi:prolyl oligopeptidase